MTTLRNGRQQRDVSLAAVSEASYSSSSSAGVHSNFSANQQQQRASTSYEPGTGAAFMAQSGWNNRDAYGRPRQSTTSFPVFTPAPRQPHQPTTASTFQQQRGSGIGTGRYTESSPPHEITFSAAPNYKKLYLIGLIVVTLLLLSLIAVIIVLLATKVFIYNSGALSSTSAAGSTQIPGSPPPNNILPPAVPPNQQPPPPPQLVTRTFECEFYILDQANQAYDNLNSFEHYQAQTIIQNALASTFEGSSLRDMSPTLSLEKLDNSGPDLRILFRLSIVVVEQNTGLRELAIRNLLLSEAGVLEGLLNRTSLDRSRVSVRLVS